MLGVNPHIAFKGNCQTIRGQERQPAKETSCAAPEVSRSFAIRIK
jgi:hypothetical protein